MVNSCTKQSHGLTNGVWYAKNQLLRCRNTVFHHAAGSLSDPRSFHHNRQVDEYLHDYPEIPILLRGDSGFSTPDLYKQCEENGTSYVIRLKENGILRGKASDLVDELDEITRNNKVDYAVVYGEFMYKAKSKPDLLSLMKFSISPRLQ